MQQRTPSLRRSPLLTFFEGPAVPKPPSGSIKLPPPSMLPMPRLFTLYPRGLLGEPFPEARLIAAKVRAARSPSSTWRPAFQGWQGGLVSRLMSTCRDNLFCGAPPFTRAQHSCSGQASGRSARHPRGCPRHRHRDLPPEQYTVTCLLYNVLFSHPQPPHVILPS